MLILAIWSLFFLGALAVAVGAYVSANLSLAGGLHRETSSSYLARAGVEWAIGRLQADTNGWDAPVEWWGDASRFEEIELESGFFCVRNLTELPGGVVVTNYGLADEERRLNLNKASEVALSALFVTATDIDATRAESIAACIADWRDADDNVLTGGAESGYYETLSPSYPCHNDEFDSVRELLLVKGVDEELFRKVSPYVTVHGRGLVNINTASRTVLLALARTAGGKDDSARLSVVERIVAYRSGGSPFKSRREMKNWLRTEDLSGSEVTVFNAMVTVLDVESSCFGGEAVGRTGGNDRWGSRVAFVYDRGKRTKVYWHEF